MPIYYCPNCGQEINPHIAHNPKGSYMEANCSSCNVRIIGGSMNGWITDITIAQKQRVTYRQISAGDRKQPPLIVIEE